MRPIKLLETSVGSSKCDQKRNQDFAKREKIEPKVFFFFAQKFSNLGPALNKPMQLKCIIEGAGVHSLQLVGVARIFDWGGKPPITCNDVIRNFQKKELFMGQRYRRMEDHKPWPGLALYQDFAKRRRLK